MKQVITDFIAVARCDTRDGRGRNVDLADEGGRKAVAVVRHAAVRHEQVHERTETHKVRVDANSNAKIVASK